MEKVLRQWPHSALKISMSFLFLRVASRLLFDPPHQSLGFRWTCVIELDRFVLPFCSEVPVMTLARMKELSQQIKPQVLTTEVTTIKTQASNSDFLF